jgi:hypothetical protein
VYKLYVNRSIPVRHRTKPLGRALLLRELGADQEAKAAGEKRLNISTLPTQLASASRDEPHSPAS